MAHLPPLSLFLLFLAVHGFVASHGSPLPPNITYNDSMCSESFRCGGVDIKYPFYLSNATQATPDYTSYYSCGYTDLKIFCQRDGETEIPILPLGQYNYTILNIFYDNRTIILADTEALGSSKCPTVSHNVTVDPEWLKYTDSFGSMTFLYGCRTLADMHIEDHQIDCKWFNPPAGSGDGVSFVFTSEDDNDSQEYELAEHCRQVVTVPVHKKALVRIGPPMLLRREYGDMLKQGFELEWKQSKEQQCYLCEKSKGRCAYGEKKEFLACLCSGGNCTSSGATAAYPNPPSGKFFRTGPSILLPSENKRPMVYMSRLLPIAISPEDKPTQFRCVSPRMFI